MKITDLLCLDAYWISGYKTRIVADNSFGTTPIIFSVFGKSKNGSFSTNLYSGESEEEAVREFIEHEQNG